MVASDHYVRYWTWEVTTTSEDAETNSRRMRPLVQCLTGNRRDRTEPKTRINRIWAAIEHRNALSGAWGPLCKVEKGALAGMSIRPTIQVPSRLREHRRVGRIFGKILPLSEGDVVFARPAGAAGLTVDVRQPKYPTGYPALIREFIIRQLVGPTNC
jgi:hypothetical protein